MPKVSVSKQCPHLTWASQGVVVVKDPPTNSGDTRNREFDPWVKKIPLSREQHSTPAFLPEEFYGQRSLVGYSPWVAKSWT